MKPSTLEALLNGDIENAIISATPGGIEAQEAAGQCWLNENSLLPKDGGLNGNNTWSDLERLGFKRTGDYDDLFYNVEFPTGWKLVPTEHSMHSNLVDERGRIRGRVFYKAAFYDRRASVTLNKRYVATLRPECGYGDNYKDDAPARGYVFDTSTGDGLDQNTIIYQTEGRVYLPDANTDGVARYRYRVLSNGLSKMAADWLDEHYPEHANPVAYW